MPGKERFWLLIVCIILGVLIGLALARGYERNRFRCPETQAEMQTILAGRSIDSLRLDNGEAACVIEHMAKRLGMIDAHGKFKGQ